MMALVTTTQLTLREVTSNLRLIDDPRLRARYLKAALDESDLACSRASESRIDGPGVVRELERAAGQAIGYPIGALAGVAWSAVEQTRNGMRDGYDAGFRHWRGY